MDNATGFYVRVKGDDGGWYAEDIANLNPRQQSEFVITMGNEDMEKWLPVILKQLCKKQSLIEVLLEACKYAVDILPQYVSLSNEVFHSAIRGLVQALALVEGDEA